MSCSFGGWPDNFVTNFGKFVAEILTSELSKLELNLAGFLVGSSETWGSFDASGVFVDVGTDWRFAHPDSRDCAAGTPGNPKGRSRGPAEEGTECGKMIQTRDDSAVGAWNDHCSLVSEI